MRWISKKVIESILPLKAITFEMTSTKTIKVFDSIYGIIVLFVLLAIVSFSLAFAFEIIFPNLYLTQPSPI